MGDIISVCAGVLLLYVSVLVIIAYRPKRGNGGSEKSELGPKLLGFAILLGFIAAAINTAWWQILGFIHYNHTELFDGEFQAVGKYMDGIFKGLATISGILHLMALKLALPKSEQRKWRWYQMPFYPSRHWTLMLFGPRKEKD